MNEFLPSNLLLVIRPGEKMKPHAASVKTKLFQPITSTTDSHRGGGGRGRITDLRNNIILFLLQVLQQFPFSFEFNSLLLEVNCHAFLVNCKILSFRLGGNSLEAFWEIIVNNLWITSRSTTLFLIGTERWKRLYHFGGFFPLKASLGHNYWEILFGSV